MVVANAGHGVMSLGCMPDVLTRFIDAQGEGSARVDASCATRIPRPLAFVPVVAPVEALPAPGMPVAATGGRP